MSVNVLDVSSTTVTPKGVVVRDCLCLLRLFGASLARGTFCRDRRLSRVGGEPDSSNTSMICSASSGNAMEADQMVDKFFGREYMVTAGGYRALVGVLVK